MIDFSCLCNHFLAKSKYVPNGEQSNNSKLSFTFRSCFKVYDYSSLCRYAKSDSITAALKQVGCQPLYRTSAISSSILSACLSLECKRTTEFYLRYDHNEKI